MKKSYGRTHKTPTKKILNSRFKIFFYFLTSDDYAVASSDGDAAAEVPADSNVADSSNTDTYKQPLAARNTDTYSDNKQQHHPQQRSC